jgi:hypothetical protein
MKAEQVRFSTDLKFRQNVIPREMNATAAPEASSTVTNAYAWTWFK